ncbi:hypothetical protein D3C71_1767460 [compost metagenome]
MADEDQNGCYEESDLQAAADGNLNRSANLVLHREHNCCTVLGCIPDNSDNKGADKDFTKTKFLSKRI